jgi:hypothetical protein
MITFAAAEIAKAMTTIFLSLIRIGWIYLFYILKYKQVILITVTVITNFQLTGYSAGLLSLI